MVCVNFCDAKVFNSRFDIGKGICSKKDIPSSTGSFFDVYILLSKFNMFQPA